MFDQNFNLSDSNVLDNIFQLPTLVVESGLGRSDLITPVVPKSLQGMDSDFVSNSVEEYQLGQENRWPSSQSLSSWPNGDDFLTGQSNFVSFSSSVDLASNTLATARAIAVGSSTNSYTDSVGSTDTNNYYCFSLANSGNFNLGLTGMTADADVQLLNSSGSVIASSLRGGSNPERITRQLSAGTYYIRVYCYTGNTNYNLAVSAAPLAPVDLAGNTLATARAITVGSSTTSYTDWVGSTDTNDYYRFTLANSGNFNLGLTGMTAGADVQLLNSSGSVIASSTNGGTASESITSQLSAGTYYIRVYPYTGDTNYNLAVSAAPLAPVDLAGNTLATARAITVGSSTTSYTDWVGSTDTNNYYCFSLANSGNFNLGLTGMTADADVLLLNSSGSVIASSTNGGTASESITSQLSAGTYYIRVYPYQSANTNYNLAVSAAPLAPVDLAGNTLATARAITVGSSTTSYTDWVGSTDTNDYYCFTLANSGNFNLGLTGMTADADVQLLNSSGSVIASSVRAGTASESITSQLSAGTYYIRVYPYTGDTNYNLAVSATTATVTPGYSAISGYGLVNAAKAVAGALNQTPFADVPTFGGANDWGVNLVNAPEAWASGYTGQGIVVAVLDTGVDRNHADLAGNIWTNAGEIANDGLDNDGNGYVDDVYGWNFANGNNNTLDGNRHGTHVAGTIAAANNGFGATGVAYNSRIMPVKVLSDSGSGSYSGVAQGIRYAVDNGADVINMSLGGGSTSSAVQSALQYASSRSVIVVMAAGNAGAAQPGYPASNATSWGLAVGAVNSSNQMASFSNRAGSNSSMRYVTAPGVQVYSTLPNGGYGFLSGTSMAAPHVAGLVALMLSANPNLTDAQVRQIITATAGNVV
ncbi:MAG: S8 family serine peptidase [bacterium]